MESSRQTTGPYLTSVWGLTPPDHAPRAAALALTLISGGVEYFSMAIDASGSPTKKQKTRIDAAFERARIAVERSVREKNLDTAGDESQRKRCGARRVIRRSQPPDGRKV